MAVDAARLPTNGATGEGTSGGAAAPSAPQETPKPENQQPGQAAGVQSPSQSAQPPASGAGAGGGAGQGAGVETGATDAPRPALDINSLDARELLENHPHLRRMLQSRAGDIGEQRAREIAEERVNEMLADTNLRKEMDYRRHLRETDPEAFARYDAEQETKWQERQTGATQARTQTVKEFWTGFDNMLFGIQFSLPIEAQREVEGKNYRDPSGDPWKSRQLYLNALTEAAIKHGVKTQLGPALTKARSEITEAATSQANGTALAGRPAPNTQGGDAPGGEYVSQAEFDQFGRGHSAEARAWRRENKERLDRSYGTHIKH